MQQQGKQQDAPQAALERGFDRLTLRFVRGGEQAAAFLLHGGQPQAEMVQGEGGRQQEHDQLAANQPEKQVAGRKQHFPAVALRCNSVAEHHCGQEHARIGQGLLVLLGITQSDTPKQATYLAEKCAGLRIFEDENGKLNRSLADVGGQMLVVSNFTLYANCSHGRRPDFLAAAKPDQAIPLYEFFQQELGRLGVPFQTGVFGADMKIDHVNDGPVTIIMDTDQMMK